eukprot:1789252-Rhodomonas_salina.4
MVRRIYTGRKHNIRPRTEPEATTDVRERNERYIVYLRYIALLRQYRATVEHEETKTTPQKKSGYHIHQHSNKTWESETKLEAPNRRLS